MIFENGETTRTNWQLRKGIFLLHAGIFILCFAINCIPQSNISRQQFARLDVLTRAAYFENEILKAANEEGVDPNILWTIAYNETRFRPWLTSPKNAQGMMQFIPSTAARFDLADPYKAVPSIRAAARYVRYLSNLFGGRIDSILAAYNSGEGTVSAYLSGRSLRNGSKTINSKGIKTIGGVPPYSETIGYVGRGLKIYRWLIVRNTFPAPNFVAKLPPVISSSVAQVQVFDRELGKVTFLNNVAPYTLNQPNKAESSAKVEPAINLTIEAIDPPNALVTEAFYDSRNGKRYILKNGKSEKLPDEGIIIINRDNRPRTSNSARSTLFAPRTNE